MIPNLRDVLAAFGLLSVPCIFDGISMVNAVSNKSRTVVVTDCADGRAMGPHQANLRHMGRKDGDLLTSAELQAVALATHRTAAS